MVRKGNYLAASPEEAAKAVLRVVPLVMRTVRAEMRACRTVPLSVPQFRALNFADRHAGASFSDVAAHIGVTLPSMSRLIDGLVARRLVIRRGYAGDRRRLTLRLTARGRALLRAARAFTESSIASRLSALGGEETAAVVRAMAILHPIFAGAAAPGQKGKPESARRVLGVNP